jgi:hypothetical protein
MSGVTKKRACDGCSMCCKLLHIEALQKPMGVWCPHVRKGIGCGIYDLRPTPCRAFECLWLSNADVPDHWRPDRSKMVLAGDETGTLISVIVDPACPDAWKKQPYYNDIKHLARQERWRVQVLTAKDGWVIFPEEDLFLGDRKADDLIVAFGYKQTPMMRQPAVTVRHGDGTETEVLGKLYPVA